jgi:hypothetical protein
MSNQYGRIGHGVFLGIIYADPSPNVPPNAMRERITPESSITLTLLDQGRLARHPSGTRRLPLKPEPSLPSMLAVRAVVAPCAP